MKKTTAAAFATIAVSTLLGCSPESPKAVTPPVGKVEKIRDSDETASFNPAVDILFVVDDSGSMGSHQTNLSNNIKQFTAEIQKNQILDYHIGVVTTAMDGLRPGAGCDNNFRVCGDGRLVRYPSGVPYVTRQTPNGLATLERNLIVGTNGSPIEMIFDPIYAALSQPMIGGDNSGFLRQDASLALLFITDAEDQSRNMNVQKLVSFLTGLKNGRADQILAYGAIIPSGIVNPACSRDTGEPLKIEQLLAVFKGTEFNVCDTDYGLKLAHIAADVVQKVGRIMYLTRPPVPETITVSYGTQDIPEDAETGWLYDPVRNALLFGPKLTLSVQPQGTKLEVNFTAGTYQ